jgi:hypothetical protein
MVKFLLYTLLFAFILGATNSCIIDRNLDELATYDKDSSTVYSSKIKLNGIYCSIYKNDFKLNKSDPDTSLSSFFLYENGTFLNPYNRYLASPKDILINNIKKDFEKNKEEYSNDQGYWGRYKIVNDTLQTLQYGGFSGSMYPYYESFYKILNDHQLLLLFSRTDTRIFDGKSQLYTFQPLLQKPDSTNLFMKGNIKKRLDRIYAREKNKKYKN